MLCFFVEHISCCTEVFWLVGWFFVVIVVFVFYLGRIPFLCSCFYCLGFYSIFHEVFLCQCFIALPPCFTLVNWKFLDLRLYSFRVDFCRREVIGVLFHFSICGDPTFPIPFVEQTVPVSRNHSSFLVKDQLFVDGELISGIPHMSSGPCV